MAFILFIATIFILLIPSEALAWGIGVHLQLGSGILNNLNILPAALQAILLQHPHDFLYGCISADITIGKKYTHYLKHCHSWRMGMKVLQAADSDRQRACGYGYLAHLAADTIAHSYFVPFKMIRTFNTALLKHTYWEVRVEGSIDPQIWSLAREIGRKNFSVNDTMMRSVLSDTIFSFSTNKRIFNSLLFLNRLQQWQKMMRSMATGSKWTLAEDHLDEYLSLAGEAVSSVLCQMEESPYWQADPTGERAIDTAKIIRKNLKLLWQEGKLSEHEIENHLTMLRPKFRQAITNPDHILEVLSRED